VLEIGVLLGAAQAITALGFGLVLVEVAAFLRLASALVAVFLYPLGLGLLVGGGSGLGLGQSLFGLLCLFALDFGIFGGVPGVEDLFCWVHVSGVILVCACPGLRRGSLGSTSKDSYIFLFLVVESAASNGRGRRNAILLFICKARRESVSVYKLGAGEKSSYLLIRDGGSGY
jgi:hypothetical protein